MNCLVHFFNQYIFIGNLKKNDGGGEKPHAFLGVCPINTLTRPLMMGSFITPPAPMSLSTPPHFWPHSETRSLYSFTAPDLHLQTVAV